MRKRFLLLLLFFCISECCISQTITTTYTYKWKYDTVYTAGGIGTKDFSYTGSYTTFSASAGTYTLEVWGAQGGSGMDNSSTMDQSYPGGKGGYSKGTLTLQSAATLYIYVAGQGKNASPSGQQVSGGFNGGGTAPYTGHSGSGGGSGGGASDIRVNNTSLYARVIVAGGGGAGGYPGDSPAGGAGGGTNGLDCSNGTGTATGGTQTSGGTCSGSYGGTNGISGTFGQGGNGGTNGTAASGGGGGGGWYGGAGGKSGSNNACRGGGGGSGYVYTSSTAGCYPVGCLLNSSHYLTAASTYAGNVSFTSTAGSTEVGHSGDGYARITYNTKVLDHIDSSIAHTYATTTITDETCGKGFYSAYGFNLKCDTLSAGIHTYQLSLHPAADRDSTVILKLNVKSEVVIFEEVESTAPYVWPVTGLSYSESGIYVADFQSENGCDSTITLALTIFSTVGFTDDDNVRLTISPNPASDYIDVVFSGFAQSEFFLYNIEGQLVKRERLESLNNRISLEEIPAGLYLMKFYSKKGTFCKKLIISK